MIKRSTFLIDVFDGASDSVGGGVGWLGAAAGGKESLTSLLKRTVCVKYVTRKKVATAVIDSKSRRNKTKAVRDFTKGRKRVWTSGSPYVVVMAVIQ